MKALASFLVLFAACGSVGQDNDDASIDGGMPDAAQADASADGSSGEVTLTVLVSGNGTGSVTSSPPGINCGTNCTGHFPPGTVVHLTASPTGGTSSFLGWSSPCSGTGDCAVTLANDTSVTAFFGVPGQNLWLKQVGSTASDFVSSIVRDSHNDVFVVGDISGAADVGGIMLTSAGNADAFVAKLSGSDGHAIWAKRFGGSNFDDGKAVAVDSTGNVFVLGTFQGTTNFGGGNVTSAGGPDIFVLKLDGATGERLWSQNFGSLGTENAGSLAVDSSDNVVVTGVFRDPMTLGGSTLTPQGASDLFLGSFAGTDGGHRWSKSLGGPDSEVAAGIAADGSGHIVLVGDFAGSASFGGTTPLVSAGGSIDIFVARYSAADGTHLSSKRYGSGASEHAKAVAVDAAGAIYLTGSFAGTMDLGGATPLMATTSSDIFVFKSSLAGAHLWSKAFGGTNPAATSGTDIALDGAGAVLVVGSFSGTVGFGGDMLSSAGESDVFIAGFGGSDGSHQFSMRLGGAKTESAFSIASGNPGQLFVTGAFNDFAEFNGETLTTVGFGDGFVLATNRP